MAIRQAAKRRRRHECAAGTRMLAARLVHCCAASIDKPFADQPFLDHLGDLVAILVHHHHVGVALDADVREVDQVDAAAGLPDRVGVVDDILADAAPARMLLGVIAVDGGDRDIFQRRDLVLVADAGRLDATIALTCRAAPPATLKANAPAWLCTSRTHGPTLSTSSM